MRQRSCDGKLRAYPPTGHVSVVLEFGVALQALYGVYCDVMFIDLRSARVFSRNAINTLVLSHEKILGTP
jgi:hypothetical protein